MIIVARPFSTWSPGTSGYSVQIYPCSDRWKVSSLGTSVQSASIPKLEPNELRLLGARAFTVGNDVAFGPGHWLDLLLAAGYAYDPLQQAGGRDLFTLAGSVRFSMEDLNVGF